MRYRIDSMSLRGGELIIDGWAFGDSENDIELLQAAGTGVAVGNAMEETKQAADYVTDDIWHDGIYKACEALGLFS